MQSSPKLRATLQFALDAAAAVVPQVLTLNRLASVPLIDQ